MQSLILMILMRKIISDNSTHAHSEVDLEITVVPNVNMVTVGDKVKFTVTVINHGPDTAVNTRAFITIPDE